MRADVDGHDPVFGRLIAHGLEEAGGTDAMGWPARPDDMRDSLLEFRQPFRRPAILRRLLGRELSEDRRYVAERLPADRIDAMGLQAPVDGDHRRRLRPGVEPDRKSTRLNSSH